MMRRATWCIAVLSRLAWLHAAFAAVLALLASGCAGAEPGRAEVGDRMARLRSVETGCSATERAEKCLALLREEMAAPSSPAMGMGGGPIDSGYVQCVIMESFLYSDSPRTTEQERVEVRDWARDALKRLPKTDKDLRDRLTVVIGHTGDKSVVPQLVDILRNHPEGYMRSEAAMALYHTNDPSSIPALKHALAADTYARVRTGGCLGPHLSREEMVYSPTRDAAARALKRMGVSVPSGAEVVDRRFIVPRLEPLLYSNDRPFLEISFLAGIGGPEAEAAVLRFIAREQQKGESSEIADFARDALERSRGQVP